MGMFAKTLSAAQRASLEFAEEAREKEWKHPSFLGELFQGNLRWNLVSPYPQQSPADKKKGDEFIEKLESFLRENIDPEKVDETTEIPDAAIKGLFEMGAFAMKIPKDYGGLGLSQINYNRAIHLIATYCGSTAVLLSAHQSIGVPQPLILFGTEEQKRKYLPRFRKDAISGFALTELDAGSDPRSMNTTAVPTEDGEHYILNGQKLWCTNGLIADVLVIMAVTPSKIIHGKERKQITAFIVERKWPGFKIESRCKFMGLHGIQNGVITFKNIKVPKENIILGEGQGLKLALTTLNTGRLTIPAAATGMAKWCLNVSRRWANTRTQWGQVIGKHESVSTKLGSMAADTFAMEAMTWLVSGMAESHRYDIRLEAAVAKLFCTSTGWRIIDDTMQIRAGCGYENSKSLRERGETDFPVERVMRDARINEIIEGTSEIMHLFIAREALDPHMKWIKPLITGRTSVGEKIKAGFALFFHYALWYPKQWIPLPGILQLQDLPAPLKFHMMFVKRQSRKLARGVFAKMMIYQKKLEAKQNILNRYVDISSYLFAMACACSYAAALYKKRGDKKNAIELADLFCRESKVKIRLLFHQVCCNNDRKNKKVARNIISDAYTWLESDIVQHELKDS